MQTVLLLFLIAFLGYLLGSITVGGVSLGTSAVLLVALVFGHFGAEFPAIVRNLGLALFVGAVGLIAGPVFFRNFRTRVYAYLLIGVLTVGVGVLATLGLGKALGLPPALSVGVFNGALTSTPGLAAAIEATGSDLAAVGYGIAYPFGVVGVVLFVQLYPKVMRLDVQKEVERFRQRLPARPGGDAAEKPLRTLEPTGLLILCAALCLGLLLGSLAVPLPGGMAFSLGVAGGPLFAGLVIGHFRRVGPVSIRVPDTTLKVVRELGLCLFLLGSGTEAGGGFVAVLREYGVVLFLFGVAITLLPLFVASALGRRLLRLDAVNTLGALTGGMTSTPALGALISTFKTEDAAAAYAATYPFALICMVIGSQVLAAVW